MIPDTRLQVTLMAKPHGLCKGHGCRAAAALAVVVRYCEECEHTEKACRDEHPESMGPFETTEVCEEHGLTMRTWQCLERIYRLQLEETK